MEQLCVVATLLRHSAQLSFASKCGENGDIQLHRVEVLNNDLTCSTLLYFVWFAGPLYGRTV